MTAILGLVAARLVRWGMSAAWAEFIAPAALVLFLAVTLGGGWLVLRRSLINQGRQQARDEQERDARNAQNRMDAAQAAGPRTGDDAARELRRGRF